MPTITGEATALRRGAWVKRLLARHGVDVRGRVLDIGCGVGSASTAFSDATLIIGLDAAFDLVARGREAGRRIDFIAADATVLPFRDGTFDAIILFDVLEHVANWRAVLAESKRVLRSGGAAFITAANPRSPITVLDDPHWHLPFVAVLPPRASSLIVSLFGGGRLEMAGIHPAFPSWGELWSEFRRCGFDAVLVGALAKIGDPESILDPTRRRIAAFLTRVGRPRGRWRRLVRPLVSLYDRRLARSWTFLAFESRVDP